MTAIYFALGIAVMFGMLLVSEASSEDRNNLSLRPASLLQWLISGNWPAKVGALLLIIGTGALLRYLMQQIAFPPAFKLMAGVLISVMLGAGSAAIKKYPLRRAIHLALGGASLGVAYLTAYSAYGFFHYLDNLQGAVLLFLVASGATIFALTSSALSIAILAMVGAYIAPAYALESAEPFAVYGYYTLASLLTLFMVSQRGWRPLIHLSFLFTLAGALFFGWTQQYYTPAYYAEMQPMLFLLVAIHLAMPLIESKNAGQNLSYGIWLQRFDLGYFLWLPITAVLLSLLICPNPSSDGAWAIGVLALLWFAAFAVEYYLGRSGIRYLGISIILLLVAGLLALENVPYFLILAVASCGLLALGPKFGVSKQLDGLLIATALSFSACYLLESLTYPVAEKAFANPFYLGHILLAAAFGASGESLRRRQHSMSAVFLTLSVVWMVCASMRELIKAYVFNLSQVIHILLLCATGIYAFSLRSKPPQLSIVVLLAGGLLFTGLSCAKLFPEYLIFPLILLGQILVSLLAFFASKHGEQGETVAGVARSSLPLLLLPWAIAFASTIGASLVSVSMLFMVISALLASLQAQITLPEGRNWPNQFSPLGIVVFGLWLLFQSLFYIRREGWDVAYEIVALAYLVMTLRFLVAAKNPDIKFFSLMTILASITVSIAMLLRLFGPTGYTLTIFSLQDMLLPAMVSLIWALIGGVMTWLSTRNQSRGLWMGGATFLVLAAIKLVLFDFDSLGQLGNIIAMMSAGAVFMLVAWLAPFPPKAEEIPESTLIKTASDIQSSQVISTNQPLSPDTTHSIAEELNLSSNINTDTILIPHDISVDATSNFGGRIWLWLLIGLVLTCSFVMFSMAKHMYRVLFWHPTASAEAHQTLPLPENKATADDLSATTKPSLPEPAPNARLNASKESATPKYLESKIIDTPPIHRNVCAFENLQLPSNFAVYAGGAYAGKNTGFQIDHSGHEATRFDVSVNEPRKPVVLILGAYEPSIWNIRWTHNTKILAVMVSGYHRQAISGLEKSVPTLNSSYDNKGACGYFYISEENQSLNPISRKLFGRSVDMVYLANAGDVSIGTDLSSAWNLQTSNETTPESYYDKNSPLAGKAGLQDAIRKGYLRPATAADAQSWLDSVRIKQSSSNMAAKYDNVNPKQILLDISSAYVVLKEFTYPAGLSGASFAVFFVPKGVPLPYGNQEHSTVYDFNTLECIGLTCLR